MGEIAPQARSSESVVVGSSQKNPAKAHLASFFGLIEISPSKHFSDFRRVHVRGIGVVCFLCSVRFIGVKLG